MYRVYLVLYIVEVIHPYKLGTYIPICIKLCKTNLHLYIYMFIYNDDGWCVGIESSCDDTGVAIVRSDGYILSNVLYSQQAIHEKFGGIVPSLAMNAHKSNIDIAVTEGMRF